MATIDLDCATITQMSGLLRSRKLSPVELTQATLQRMEKLQSVLLAFATPTPEYAMLRATQAEKEIAQGRYRGPLHGIPYTLKDWIDVRGIRTTFGAAGAADASYMPGQSATVHTLLEQAGAILVGKVVPGIAIGRAGTGPVACRNPWDTTRSPGTSSSGSGSATAASLGLVSVGVDTGGSVRHPGSNCALVAMLPTRGRISGFGIKGSPITTDQAGPLTKTVEDNAIVSSVLAGYDPKDPASIREPRDDYAAGLRDGIRGTSIGVPVDDWIWKDWLSEEEEEVVRRALAVLEELGARVVDVKLPLAAEARALLESVGAGSALYYLEHFSKEQLRPWPEVVADLEASLQRPVRDHLQSTLKRARLRQEVEKVLTTVDLIALPTGSTYGDAWDAETAVIRSRTVPVRLRAAYRNAVANLCGHPALTVPCGFGNRGRWPIGLMLQGGPLEEALLYRVAHAYELATDWHLRHPQL